MHFPLPVSTGLGLLLAALASALITATAPTGRDDSPRASQSRAPGQTATLHEARTVKINIKVKDRVVSGTLNGSQAARDFASLLPLSLTLTDYASTEKISDLPKRLSTEGGPPGFDPSAGDIAYYAPWGNLAIFYRDFRYSSGLVALGKLDSGLDMLTASDSMQATVELAHEQSPAAQRNER